MTISQRAFDMTVAEEVTSKAYYIKHYQKPEWPGVSSGVTVAIGYDLGQASRGKIAADWGKLVSADMLLVMQSCSGITGSAAKAKCAEVKNKISIPWDAAIAVFANRDVPSWTSAVLRAVPGAEKLNGDLLGVLFDIAYNRGCAFSNASERFAEMRAIKHDVGAGVLRDVPVQIKGMKRLWPGVTGLLNRCDHRIALWNSGMGTINPAPASVPNTPIVPDPTIPLNAGPARTKPPATTPAQHTTTGAIVAGGGAAAKAASDHGFSNMNVILIIVAAVVVAGSVWWAWYRNRNPK